jgi:predicted nucleic acid-binding protein
VFLDVLLKRENYIYSLNILNSILDYKFIGCVSDITLLNIDYIAKKQTKNIKEFLKLINDYFIVVGADNHLINLALNIDNNDFEDNVQFCIAKLLNCKVLITNDKKFVFDDIEILSSLEFAKKYL